MLLSWYLVVMKGTFSYDQTYEFAIFRFLRVIRIFTIAEHITPLKLITHGFYDGLKSSVYIIFLLFMVLFIGAVMGVQFFGNNDPANFGVIYTYIFLTALCVCLKCLSGLISQVVRTLVFSLSTLYPLYHLYSSKTLGAAGITMFQVSTTTSWSSLAYTSIYGCDEYANSGYTNGEVEGNVSTKTTLWGTFKLWDCNKPNTYEILTPVFYVVFIGVSFATMSLFIASICMAMFASLQKHAL